VKVQWSERALLDLEDLLEFIAVDNPGAASRLHGRVFRKTDQLAAFPDLGPVSAEAGEPFREALVKPLRILYLHEGKMVTIVAVYREEADVR
jgi:toxin ParE1/3/4